MLFKARIRAKPNLKEMEGGQSSIQHHLLPHLSQKKGPFPPSPVNTTSYSTDNKSTHERWGVMSPPTASPPPQHAHSCILTCTHCIHTYHTHTERHIYLYMLTQTYIQHTTHTQAMMHTHTHTHTHTCRKTATPPSWPTCHDVAPSSPHRPLCLSYSCAPVPLCHPAEKHPQAMSNVVTAIVLPALS